MTSFTRISSRSLRALMWVLWVIRVFFVSAREFEPDGVVRLEREIELGDWAWALRVGRWREKNYSLLKIWRERI